MADEHEYASDAESDESSMNDDLNDDEFDGGAKSKKPKIKIYNDDDEASDSDLDELDLDEIVDKRKADDDDVSDNADSDDESEPDDDDDDELKDNKQKRKELAKLVDLSDTDGSDEEDENDDDEEDENYLQKFEKSVKTNLISDYHPEMRAHNYDEIDILSRIVRNEQGVIIDPLHRTLPFITKYEKARILGERAKQINAGGEPMVKVDEDVIDGYLIALEEFNQKKIPFIIRRPMPNGGAEYWKVKDLE